MADNEGTEHSELQRLNDYLCNLDLSGGGEEALEDYLLRRSASALLAAAPPLRESGETANNRGPHSAT